MPRNNKKSKASQSTNNNADMSDDEFSNDTASIYSYQSRDSEEGEGDSNAVENFESKLDQSIEGAQQKSAQTRTESLQVLNKILSHSVATYNVENQKATIIDIIEKSLKKGKGQEQALAAKLASVLLIQLHGDEEIVKTLAPLLQTTASDKTATPDARANSCTSLALLNFLGGDDIGDLIHLCHLFEGIFMGSYLKEDTTKSAANIDTGVLQVAALNAWALLLTLIPSGDVVSLIETKQILGSFKDLLGLFQSKHVEVRVTAGEVTALLLESGREHDEEFLSEYLSEMIEASKSLATDSQKFRAKRDRKQQRATFRDVLTYIEEETVPDVTIQVGNGKVKEHLVLDSFAMSHQYNSICNALGSGMNIHLVENEFIRDIFQMGAKIDASQVTLKKMSKNEKRAVLAASFKARTISRGKNRDKRSAVVS